MPRVASSRWRAERTTGRGLAVVAMLVALIGACGQAPSPSAPPEPQPAAYALACWDVPPGACERIAAQAVAGLPAEPRPVAIDVADGSIVVETAGASGRVRAPWSLEPGEPVVLGDWTDEPFAVVAPATTPILGVEAPFALGHCGLGSPIDIDGSLWDPHGPVDGDATEAINAADGRFRRTSATTAEFLAPSGFRVTLVRHVGPSAIALCD